MRRSLLLRLLGLALSVASLAVGATALLATYGTDNQLRDELESSASLLETDSGIRGALSTYANEHRSWAGVESLVRELAERTGRRIALTTPEGASITDSAELLGTGPADLPSTPAARIDAAAVPTPDTSVEPNVVAREPTSDAGFVYYGWQLTEQERRQRQELADEVVACLARNGDGAGKATYRQVLGPGAPDPAPSSLNSCAAGVLFEPSAAARDLRERIVERTTACLDAHHLAYQVGTDSRGMSVVQSQQDSPVWTNCVDAARVEAKRPQVAPSADLYLGSTDRFDPFSPDSWWRTVATATAVLLAATIITVLVGRRVVRPIGALTAAAQRMAGGDHTARVPVHGNDEVAQLADAFNTMAGAIDTTGRQRRALVSDVAHELRTPLANVRSQLDAAQDGVVPLDPSLIQSLIDEAELLERLVVDLQDLALADAGMLRLHPEERDAADLAEQAVAAHRAQAEASGVDLRLNVAEPVAVHADPTRLRQALGNLVSNAVRHTRAGGTVEVTVRRTADAVVLAVADTGSGIAPEHLPHIFDRLYRAAPSRGRATGGSGLGLAITKHLVEAHHGHLEVTSTPGNGSTFTIRLPQGPAAIR